MRLPLSITSAGITAGIAIVIASAWGDDPKPETADPAVEIIEKLLDGLKDAPPTKAETPAKPVAPTEQEPPVDDGLVNPLAPPAPPVSSPAPKDPAAEVINDVDVRSRAVSMTNQRNAAVLYQQARAAEASGRFSEAIRLIGQGHKLDPNNAEINAYLAALQRKVAAKNEHQPTVVRATAHLAAAMSHGRRLIEQGRYTEGVDLLQGVCKATSLFPHDANVAIYRRQAERDLADYRDRVAKGLIRTDEASEAGTDEEPVLVPIGAASPLNARRILRTAENATPNWYATIKNRLAFKMNVDYVHEPVGVVLEAIEQATGVKIMIDDPVAKSRAHLSTKVDFRISEVPAETILDIACQKAGLEYVIMERGLIVTTPARAARFMKDLPESVRDNWLAARVVFPDLTPELLALPPLPNSVPGDTGNDRNDLDRDVPIYLRSGDALVKDIQSLLKQR